MSLEQRNADFCKAQTDAQMAYIEAEREVDRLQAENTKLRELVQKMMRFMEDGDWCTTCEVAKECDAQECDAQEQYEEDCLMRGVFHDRMRELGVEVDG